MAHAPRKLDQVVEAAIAEFQEHGFTGANMDCISERASVSKRTLYNYFKSKEALFVEIIQRACANFSDDAPCTFDPALPVSDQLTDLALRMLAPYRREETVKIGRLVVGEKMRNPEIIGDLAAEIEITYPAEAFFASAEAAGALNDANAETLAKDFLAFAKGRSMWPAVLDAVPISDQEASAVAREAAMLFAGQFKDS